MTTYRKKLIEVALPLPEINDASAYDKMPGIGPHPKGIHHWWARLPLPTARAVLFASVVDDPSAHPERFPTEEDQNLERERLFGILRRMMQKKLHEHPEIYAEAHQEMLKHCNGKLPPVLDPFAGGGSIPLEANRLGFETHAGDLNPVAVLLNKCNLEIVPRWADHPPVNPKTRDNKLRSYEWKGADGLADDVRYYGRLIRQKAIEKIGHLYPRVRLPKEYGGGEANVIAWIWARTVASPNPAAKGAYVPLISTYWLSSKKGTLAWLEPVVYKAAGTYHFEVRTGTPADRTTVSAGTKIGKGGFRCLLSGTPITFEYIRNEGQRNRMGMTLLAVVAEVRRGRIYLKPTAEQAEAAAATASGYPETDLPEEALGFRVQNYGIRKHSQLFTPRQLTTMVTLSDLVKTIWADMRRDAVGAGMLPEDADAYARTVTSFLALALDRCGDFNNVLCVWAASNQKVMHLFTRQALPMVWDFGEANMLGESVGAWHTCSEYVADCVEVLTAGSDQLGYARQIDAATGANGVNNLLVSTDPPYYDNIGYAVLSDFFYIWLRRTIGELYPELFSTVLVPKIQELTASPEQFGGDKQRAREHFESGFRNAFSALREKMDPRFPLTVYYAFKQDDEDSGAPDDGDEPSVDLTTGWETLLEALVSSGFQITATWPVRASQAWRMRAVGSNALASYIVLACRQRGVPSALTDRRSFVAELKRMLPDALRHLQQGNIAPVDLAQASIGPGMAVFSRYSRVMEASGKAMTVRTALALINQTLDEVLAEQEGEFDADTRWALAWFEQHGTDEGEFGVAETLSKAKNTAINGLVEDGMVSARGGKVKLIGRNEMAEDWDPATDKRLTIWEATQHLIRALDKEGEQGAADLLRTLGGLGETARDLAYRLYSICERKKWAQEALAYNSLVIAWPEITKLAQAALGQQTTMFDKR